jgi:PAS domain S-box-containing protein
MNMSPDKTICSTSYIALLRSLYLDTGDSVIIVTTDLKVIDANHHTCDTFGIPLNDLVGTDCRMFFFADDRKQLTDAFNKIVEDEGWAGELNALRGETETFPVDVTVQRLKLIDRRFFGMVIKDLSENIILKERLRQEKSNRREMYVTLRNLMKAFEKEKSGIEKTISYKLEKIILPSLDKIRQEPSDEIRNGYLKVLREELIGLTRGFSHQLDGRFLALTRTEMKVCQLIKAGLSSKEVAVKMNLAYDTIQTHRKNIRRKLGLRGRKINLYSLLASKSFFSHVSE